MPYKKLTAVSAKVHQSAKSQVHQSAKSSFMFFEKIVFKKVLKSFRRVLKSKNSLKS
jgi:hypothetical protein